MKKEVINDDCFNYIDSIKDNSIDFICTDPPYFLSNGGISCSAGEVVSVNKGKWDEGGVEKKQSFNEKWILKVKSKLKYDGTICIFTSKSNIFSIGQILEENNFDILNLITWEKLNPPPNMSKRTLTHSTEMIVWAKKIKNRGYTFNYDLAREINGGKQLKDVWRSSIIKKKEKEHGYHPTQKPLWIMERLVSLFTNEGDVVLDPFAGSGTTGVACEKLNRNYICIEKEKDYYEIMKRRVNE